MDYTTSVSASEHLSFSNAIALSGFGASGFKIPNGWQGYKTPQNRDCELQRSDIFQWQANKKAPSTLEAIGLGGHWPVQKVLPQVICQFLELFIFPDLIDPMHHSGVIAAAQDLANLRQ